MLVNFTCTKRLIFFCTMYEKEIDWNFVLLFFSFITFTCLCEKLSERLAEWYCGYDETETKIRENYLLC